MVASRVLVLLAAFFAAPVFGAPMLAAKGLSVIDSVANYERSFPEFVPRQDEEAEIAAALAVLEAAEAANGNSNYAPTAPN